MIETQSLSVSEAKALFFNSDALIISPRQLYRINNHANGRYYYSFKNGVPQFYISVTTLIQATMPTPFELVKWIAGKGLDEAELYKEERGGYGTFMHRLFERLLIDRKIDLDAIDPELLEYCTENNYGRHNYSAWLHEIKRDVLGFAAWMVEYEVEPLAIELMLASDKYGIAGALDLVCNMTIPITGFLGEIYKTGPRKGEPKETAGKKRVRAIVDFKSGRKGFFENHEIQLEAYRLMFEENYPELPIEKLYNYGPSDWKKDPGYKLKDQTDSPNLKKFLHLAKIGFIESQKRERYIKSISGVIDLNDKDYTTEKNVKSYTLEDYVTRKTASLKNKKQ
jgi:hypothetical protein